MFKSFPNRTLSDKKQVLMTYYKLFTKLVQILRHLFFIGGSTFFYTFIGDFVLCNRQNLLCMLFFQTFLHGPRSVWPALLSPVNPVSSLRPIKLTYITGLLCYTAENDRPFGLATISVESRHRRWPPPSAPLPPVPCAGPSA
jgi:hypothetical protein